MDRYLELPDAEVTTYRRYEQMIHCHIRALLGTSRSHGSTARSSTTTG
ncbi:hypothetical protein WIS52_15155 [Pseudonocardia nematodicida]|uniref:Uncharacterized protein n=1 Tax=Pseudonocardia nematodicida TaxID=1206997 RepID=A0ABV1KD19_9PSEU